MPQITLEYTTNIVQPVRTNELMRLVHETVADVIGLPLENCKSRVVALDHFFVGSGGETEGFVHLDVRLLAGRPPESKRRLGEALISCLESYFTPAREKLDLQITVEVRDIDRDAYFKWPPGTLGGDGR